MQPMFKQNVDCNCVFEYVNYALKTLKQSTVLVISTSQNMHVLFHLNNYTYTLSKCVLYIQYLVTTVYTLHPVATRAEQTLLLE